MLLILHKHIISKLCIFTAVASRSAVRPTIRLIRYIKHFAVRTAGAVFQSPPVILCRQIKDIFLFKAGFNTILRTLFISRRIVVSFKYRCGKVICVKPKDLGQKLKAPLAAFLFEVVSKTPASHHLKKGYMAFVPYGINVIGTDAPLYIAKPCSKRMLLPQKIGHQGLHPGYIKQNACRAV